MPFPFPDFESHLPSGIRQKGEDYFMSGNVANLAQDGDGWAADVFGTDEYYVEIDIRNGTVENWECDCPYDWGPICKHVAAVLFSIKKELAEREETEDHVGKTWGEMYRSRPSGKKKPGGPLAEIVGKLPEAELRKLLHYFAKREDGVRSHLLTKYSHLLEVASPKSYRDLVASIVSSHEGRDGYIEYREASRLGSEMSNLLTKANPSEGMATAYLCEEVIRQIGEEIKSADDSSGELGGAIATAIEVLKEVWEAGKTEVKNHVFESLLRECESGKHDGYGMDDQLRDAAADTVSNKKQAGRMLAFLEKFILEKEKEEYGKYAIEPASQLKMQLLEKWHSPEAATDFHDKNLHLHSFRAAALERAFAQKNWAEVRRLAGEGIEQDRADSPGYVRSWEDWLMKLAEATDDKTALVDMLEKRFLSDWGGGMDYYRKLKKTIPAKDFKKKTEEYLLFFKNKTSRFRSHFNQSVANILEEEKRWDELMDMVEENPSLHLLDHYQKHLAKGRKEQYAALYEKQVRALMDTSSNRNGYVECIWYLKKIKSLGFAKKAKQVANDWRETYPRRRALMDELGKAGY